ncbi:CHAT domain-containing protein [Hymenobacter sp. ASUV-10]|uniref:CHAT domain-containing protein n=2 Tax=Hymenobacter aranciens TaxID=3063996 RepID=A0ABT9BM51_9BACT|nr:CHAT domain-containing protein [Hymenobacter sp. ASUV-10]
MAEAFARQEMILVDHVAITSPLPTAARRGVGEGTPTLEVVVPLAEQEDAAILLEQDGFYSWHFEPNPAVASRPGRQRGASPTRQVQLRIPLSAALPEAAPDQPTRRGVVGDFLRGKIKAFIYRFAARVVVGQAVTFLERNVRRGLVHIASLNPANWTLVANPAGLPLPTGRPARILLLVHGTFSSTVGAYTALTATPWGQTFLTAALNDYDLVLGFDHPTLSVDPLENASDLLAALQTITWPAPPRVDVVAHSRGGLVFRCLVEHLLPLTSFTWQLGRVVFVGVTNAGTLLAAPANWQALVDLYTNLTAATCQLLRLMPQATAVSLVLEELVRSLGAFVKYCATTAVTDRLAPGLAAMEPGGEFITRLNEEQPRQPTIAQTDYCAITSDFQPQVRGGVHEPRELPARLLQWLGSSFMGALMQEANDLVVHTASMTQLDASVGTYFKDVLAFGTNPQVYHTNYFVRPEVTNALTRWLRLRAPQPPLTPTEKRQRKPAPKSTPGPGRAVEADLPASVDVDVCLLPATLLVREALQLVQTQHPSYVIVQQSMDEGHREFAFATEHLLALPKTAAGRSLADALHLARTTPSPVLTPGTVPDTLQPLLVPQEQGRRHTTGPAPEELPIIAQQGRSTGVVPPLASGADGPALAALARKVASPRQGADEVLRRRLLPSFLAEEAGQSSRVARQQRLGFFVGADQVVAGAGSEAPATPRPRPTRAARRPTPMPAPCHFRAEMEQQVLVGRPAVLEVLVAREALASVGHNGADAAQLDVPAGAPLTVQILPKVNFEWVEPVDQYTRTVEAPTPGAPQSLYFTLRATHTGEGEVWVVVRQNQVPLLTLHLRPEVVTARSTAAGRRTQAEAPVTPAAAPTPALHQLVITERRNGSQLSYHFQLQLPDLGVLQWGETQPFAGDRQAYVAQLYQEIEQRWVSSHADATNFAAELQALGGVLFNELLPADLQRVLWQHRAAIRSILVIAEEPFIPWELVCLHEPGRSLTAQARFFGELGLVRWLHAAGWPRQQLRLRKGKRYYVVPHYPHPDYVLPGAEDEEEFLRNFLHAKAVSPTAQSVRTLLQQGGGIDLLHFACHGEANAANIANAQLLLEGRLENGAYLPEYLGSTIVAQFTDFGSDTPLVVLNACQAGRLGYQLTGVGGFAQAFLSRGAGAFLGSLWAIGDASAGAFSQALYEALLAGQPLAEAVTTARQRAREDGDPTWLSYVVYGHPYATVATT